MLCVYLRDALRHQPQPLRLRARHDLPRQEQLRGDLLGQQPREEVGGGHALFWLGGKTLRIQDKRGV